VVSQNEKTKRQKILWYLSFLPRLLLGVVLMVLWYVIVEFFVLRWWRRIFKRT